MDNDLFTGNASLGTYDVGALLPASIFQTSGIVAVSKAMITNTYVIPIKNK
jgi:hypothetical protein